MTSRRKYGVGLDIPFVDDSSGVMANGVAIGRPATPPIIRITIPERYQTRLDKNDTKETKAEVREEVKEEEIQKESAPLLSGEPDGSKEGEDEVDGGKDDSHGELPNITGAPLTRRHRRNSISLPAGLDTIESQPRCPLRRSPRDNLTEEEIGESSVGRPDLGMAKQNQNRRKIISDNTNGETDDTFSETEESENVDVEAPKVPMRSARKKSIMPMRSALVDSDLDLPEHSPGNSITSINSISSLLKEKLSMVAIPGLRKAAKKPKNYKLKAFVAILFLCIVFLVGFAYVFYHQQVLQRAYFERIRFNKEERIVRLYDYEDNELLSGTLGKTIYSDLVFKCLPRDELNDGSVCMEWMHRARLYLQFNNPHEGVFCYQITWESLDPLVNPTDCFDWSKGGHWYGGGQAKNMTWPAELGVVKLSPFITGDVTKEEWGNVLKRYFLNSKGVSISIDSKTPLYTAIDTIDDKKQFCIQARHDDFAYFYHNTFLPRLNYSICTSNNIKVLHGYMSEKSLWDGLKEQDIATINSLLTEPVWQISPHRMELMTEATVYNYTEDVIALAFLRQGHVLLSEQWQKNLGDFAMDTARFPTMKDTIQILQRRGFKIVLSIHPFISTESVNFKTAVKERLLVSERSSDHIPALTRYKGSESAGMLDITNNQSVPWLQELLHAVVKKYNVNSFYLDLGTAYNMPHFYRFEQTLLNPDEYKTLFTEAVLQHVEVIGVSSAVKRPRPPVFVSLPPLTSTWESLTLIIPTVLTYGIIGYPFIMPGPVGGDIHPDLALVNYTSIYLKAVENEMSKKVDTSPFKTKNQSEVKPVVKEEIPTVKERLPEEDTEEEFDVDIENTTKVHKIDLKPNQTEEGNVFTTNYDNFFNKNVNVSTATDIMKNISASNPIEVLEKASESFPGDVMFNDHTAEFTFLPDKELYIRWLQLATFLPVIRFTHLPSKYKDDSLLEMAKALTSLRVKIVNPLLKKYAKEALDSGLPIIRPLWMLDPSDPTCHTVVDEFSVGEELIVAPVIQEGTTEREVYLPAGVWKDGIDGSLRKGSRWIHKYRVPQTKIAYFVKMPDNTRF